MKFNKRRWSVVGSLVVAVGAFPFLGLYVGAFLAHLFIIPVGYLLKKIGFQGWLLDVCLAIVAVSVALIIAATTSLLCFLACRWTNVRDEPRCPKCKSELSGNVLPICPECGEALPPNQSEAVITPKPSIPVRRVDD